MSLLAGRRLRLLVALLALWGALMFAHAAPPSSEEGGTVGKVGSGLPSGSVFRGAPPLHHVSAGAVHTSDVFVQGGFRSNRGWPGHRHPKTAIPQTVPGDTEVQTAPQLT